MADTEKIDELTDLVLELQGIAQAGLFYASDPYDQERYTRIRQIAVQMLSLEADLPCERVKALVCRDSGYPTPKIDTRAVVFKDSKLLLVRETNGKWALPGGWCEANLSPVDNVIKEAKEESGRDVAVKSVISVQNRDAHNHPPFVCRVIKIYYLCDDLGGSFEENTETLDARYFARDEICDLDESRTTLEQVDMCFAAVQAEHWDVQFD